MLCFPLKGLSNRIKCDVDSNSILLILTFSVVIYTLFKWIVYSVFFESDSWWNLSACPFYNIKNRNVIPSVLLHISVFKPSNLTKHLITGLFWKLTKKLVDLLCLIVHVFLFNKFPSNFSFEWHEMFASQTKNDMFR